MGMRRLNPDSQGRDVLFTGDTNGTVTLSSSAANYSHMAIYFRSNDGSHDCAQVYSPNGKNVDLSVYHIGAGSTAVYWKGRWVKISGTSITTVGTQYAQAYATNGSNVSLATSNFIYITRVEAWNYPS